MSNRGCRNHPDIFCYICGQYTLIRARNVIDGFVKKAYIAYFGIHIGDQDKPWAPHIVCARHIYANRPMENEIGYHLGYQWCGGLPVIIIMIVIFVW